MFNFIDLHLKNGDTVVVNVKAIASFNRWKEEGVTLIRFVGTDSMLKNSLAVVETVDEIKGLIADA